MDTHLSEAISLPPVIVIDDDREDLELIRAIGHNLQPRNELVLFNSPENALQYLQRVMQPPALIICDVNMPRLNGFELRSQMLAEIPLLDKVPFFYLSTSKTATETSSAETLQARGYYEKPNTFEGLRDNIRNILEIAGLLP